MMIFSMNDALRRYQPGDYVEYNSVTLGGWAVAIVDEVYQNGDLRLLGAFMLKMTILC